jgi:hypothetical protein
LIVLYIIFSPWDQEPNNAAGNEDCAVIYADGKYNDVDCELFAHIACEKRKRLAAVKHQLF